jgi:Tc toxin complex TcA C-terminal TcB-binding domain
MTEQFRVTGNLLPSNDENILVEGKVQVFDRDLPSLEHRGNTPQLLGESPLNADAFFTIEYTDNQFRKGEGEPAAAPRSNKINADLSFKIFDPLGLELNITRILVGDREYQPDEIIFNAPTELNVTIYVDVSQQSNGSEYERLVASIAPVIQDLPVVEITDEDVIFLLNEFSLEEQDNDNIRAKIQWLRRSALLANQTNIPIEAFYGWGRVSIPSPFAELVAVPFVELPALLKKLLAETNDSLRGGLQTAVSDLIIPNLGDRIDEILAQIDRLRVEQGSLTARRLIGKLSNERSNEPLVGLNIRGFDLDAGAEPKDLGLTISNNDGVFTFNYITLPSPVDVKRQIRLQVLINPQTQETFETIIQAGGDQEILKILVPIALPPEPESHQLTNLASTLQLDLPAELLPFLAGKNINTLADIRKAGGISRLEGLPIAVDNPAVKLLEAHTDLVRISPDVQVNALMIENSYNSVTAIAKATRPDFVTALHDRVGDFKAAQLQVAARAQNNFLDNLMFQERIKLLNGEGIDPLLADKVRCRCRDCEAAVSPLAYLADLLVYATTNIKNNKPPNNKLPINIGDLALLFHQPFDLPTSCEAVDTQIRQVRLCIEVLRKYIGTRPLADATAEAVLAKSEQEYRLAVYTALLTKIGTNYADLRLARSGEPALRQSLADRLGIDLSHLNSLFLDPSASPALLNEAALERLFGLVDTSRDPFTSVATAEFQTWRLEQLRTLWKSQDFPMDGYEDGENAIALKQLPIGVVFAPPLDPKFSYDIDRQQLICQGEMTPAERNILLALAPDPIYQQAVNQLFQISQRLPIIDPDAIGPDDFRRPVLKTNLGDPDRAFDLWKKRRDWVDQRLQAFSSLTKLPPGETQRVPDIAAMFAAMYQPVTYGAISMTAWASTTPSTEFENLRSQLTQGIDVKAIKFRLLDDLHLPVDHFTHLMEIEAKAKLWDNDRRSKKVKNEEWQEVYSILVQAQKSKLFAAWRKEETAAGIQLTPQDFWISLRQPVEGEWPPTLSTSIPLIDPTVLKLKDLPEDVVGERAIAFWQARQTRLEQIPKDLATERQTNSFDTMLRLALGNPNPGNPLQHDLVVLKSELSNPDPIVVASATTKITNDFHLTVDNFKRLLVIKAKNDDLDPQKKPTVAEWAELYAILTPARKIKHEFPIWVAEERNAVTGVFYWSALKAKLPRWRSTGDVRPLWQQALRNHNQPATIDPDLIGPSDLKNPIPGNPAFDIWKAREVEIAAQLAQLVAAPKTLAGLDTNLQSILGISVVQFLKIADDQDKGNLISDRLVQLSLETAEFNYLLRLTKLANQAQPILDLEWESVYSILIQVWKRRQSAQWRSVEKAQAILLSSYFFQIPTPEPLQFPPKKPAKEPTVADIWRFSRVALQDWQDKLQSRLDQEQTTIQAVSEAVSAAEEATLPRLRDALILAIATPGDFEAKAKWVTANLLIDAKMSGCSLTTRVAQAIETIQGLILALRTGQLADLYKTFTLNLDNFDEKWKWIGSYPAWRSAMFAFLYPELILQPSLRKWQTPAFKNLVQNTGANRRLTVSDACEEARKYAEYFQDVCTLRVEATCTSRTRLTNNNGCSKSDKGYRCLFYMFGRGAATNTVYWSAYDPQDSSSYAQTFWSPIDRVKGLDNVVEIIGATPYQVSSNQRYIFLFMRKLEGAQEKLICAKYDLERKYWLEEVLQLETPLIKTTTFFAVVKQQDTEDEPPQIALSNGFIAVERKLSLNGTGWAENPNNDFFTLVGADKVEGMISVSTSKESFGLLTTTVNELEFWLFIPKTSPRIGLSLGDPKSSYKVAARHSFGDVRYLGAFSSPGNDYSYVITAPKNIYPEIFRLLIGASFWRVRDIGSQALEVIRVHSPLPNFIKPRIVPTSGKVDNFPEKFKRFVYQEENAVAFTDRFIPSSLARLGSPTTEGDLDSVFPLQVMPSLNGPFNIPIQLSAQDLQVRKGQIQKAFENNLNIPISNIDYFKEAYYFVPLTLALSLQRSGDYIAALDLFRTFYDYTTDKNARKIYYGLFIEGSLPNTYKRGADWLFDPLNPHAIAATRKNTYTRFTILAIVRCLLDSADAEFTQDTPESNPRARRFYSIVLELLESEEFKQEDLNKCDQIIGVLDDVMVPDDRWQFSFLQIQEDLKAITDPEILRPVVMQVQQALIVDAPFEQRFANAKSIVNQAIISLPPAPNLTTVIQENEDFNHLVQHSVLADPSLTTALESVSNFATEDFQRTVTMVTGISPARLEVRAVELPWLRETTVPSVNAEDAQFGTNLASSRRDVAKLDVLAPSYMTTLAEAASLQPMNAVNLVIQARESYIPQPIVGFCIPPNPLLKALRLRAEVNLYKLRTCRNIAGLKRQLEPYAAPTDTTSGLPSIGVGGQLTLPGIVRLQPTLYRYSVLIERAKQLVQLASQIEAALLASLEKGADATYNLLKARQELGLAQANVNLQRLRLTQSLDGIVLAGLQKSRSQITVNHFESLIEQGLLSSEQQALELLGEAALAYASASGLSFVSAGISGAASIAGAIAGGAAGAAAGSAAAPGGGTVLGAVGGAIFGALTGGLGGLASGFSSLASAYSSIGAKRQTRASILQAQASYERRRQDWSLQLLLGSKDVEIGQQQILIANDQKQIVEQEKTIAELQSSNAKDIVEFLTTKFTNIDLYDWMSDILEDVYRFFLQQANSMAKLAENQLAFERQEVSPAYIQSNYWNAPANGSYGSNPNTPTVDRKGLTGSARLLQDIYQLDQYAFDTNKRKIQLVKTISLALLSPAEFQRFIETGVLIFAIPMDLFDRDFPGHYLRLIRRVRTSVIALIPPIQGIKATLTSSGLTRTVIGSDIFQTTSIRRDPEFVALTSPSNSSGVFELESLQPEFLLPFEGNGVDSTWEFRMPKASNQFDYRSIADVLITIEYTALNSFDYRQQVIQTLNPNLSADRPFSFRNQFADQWYDLNNPEQTKTPMKVKFQTIRQDFPPNVETLKIQQVLLYFIRASQKTFELPITELRFTEQGIQGTVGGTATPIDGIISTRRGNGGSWTSAIGKTPVGEWELTLPNTEEVRKYFQNEELDDILFVITYSGRTPEWPS